MHLSLTEYFIIADITSAFTPDRYNVAHIQPGKNIMAGILATTKIRPRYAPDRKTGLGPEGQS